MHTVKQLIRTVNKTHKGLGAMVAMNILAAKAKKTILNIAPAGCGKSVAQKCTTNVLHERSKEFTSLTLAGMYRLKDEFAAYDGMIAIDDLGAEKRVALLQLAQKAKQFEYSEASKYGWDSALSVALEPPKHHNNTGKPNVQPLSTQSNTCSRNTHRRLQRLSITKHTTSTAQQFSAKRRMDSSSTRQGNTLLPPNKTSKPAKLPANSTAKLGRTNRIRTAANIQRQTMVSASSSRANTMELRTHKRTHTRPVESMCSIRWEEKGKCN